MKRTKSLVESIIHARNEEVAHIVNNDPRVVEAMAEYDALIENIEAATSFETSDAIVSAVSHLSSVELDAAYRVGLLDGVRLAQELRDLGTEYEHILKSFRKPEVR